jgi:hypothetical protein
MITTNYSCRNRAGVSVVPSLTSAGKFADHLVARTLRVACGRVGLDPRGAELIHVTNNVLYRLRDGKVVVRIAGGPGCLDDARQLVRVARWLEGEDFPAVRLVCGLEQPVAVEEPGTR